MTAIVGGLLTALCWGFATVCGSRGSRIAGSARALAWQVVIGSVLVVPFVLMHPNPLPVGGQWWLILIAGAGNVIGLLLEFQGLRAGPVAVVATLASLEGVIAAAVAMLNGERPPFVFLALLPLLVGGLIMVTHKSDRTTYSSAQWTAAISYGVAAGLSFGLGLYATGRLSESVSTVWAVLPSRFLGVIGLTIPLLLAGKLRVPRAALPWIVCSGVADTLGFLAFALGSSEGISTAAVLASQFAVVSTIVAAILLKERLTARQNAGVVIVAVSVAAFAAVRAGS